MSSFARKWLCGLGIVLWTGTAMADHRWLTGTEARLTTDGKPIEHPLPNPNSGPTTNQIRVLIFIRSV